MTQIAISQNIAYLIGEITKYGLSVNVKANDNPELFMDVRDVLHITVIGDKKGIPLIYRITSPYSDNEINSESINIVVGIVNKVLKMYSIFNQEEDKK